MKTSDPNHPNNIGEGFAPSPVPTGEGWDEGEFERLGRSINLRLHRSLHKNIAVPAVTLKERR